MGSSASETLGARAVENERRFVLAIGGFALRIAGATLVTHEKLPSPRFNFVEVHAIAPDRQTAFFERVLDHYFQRAIRPTIRVPPPVPPSLDRGLRALGLRPRLARLEFLAASEPPTAPPGAAVPREARASELDLLAAFWTGERERPEFRTALEVLFAHPNPGERLRAVVAEDASSVVAAALVYRHGDTAGIYAVSTQPGARGQGAASAVVSFARAPEFAGPDALTTIPADSPRLRTRLERLGFRTVASYVEYELPSDAVLAIPPIGPAAPARWRPPRALRPRSE